MESYEIEFPNDWKCKVFEYDDKIHLFVLDAMGRDVEGYLFDGPNFRKEFVAFLACEHIQRLDYNRTVQDNDLLCA